MNFQHFSTCRRLGFFLDPQNKLNTHYTKISKRPLKSRRGLTPESPAGSFCKISLAYQFTDAQSRKTSYRGKSSIFSLVGEGRQGRHETSAKTLPKAH
jgi:hypothetical protein